MVKDGVNIRGFVRYKGDYIVENFYDANRFEEDRVGREFIQKLIDTHRNILSNESGNWRYPVLYRFEIRIYRNGYLLSKKNSVFIRKDLFEWKLLSRQIKTYDKEFDIIV